MQKVIIHILPFVLGLLLLATVGCFSDARIHGGSINFKASSGAQTIQNQSQDPKNSTSLNQDSERVETLIVPAGSVLAVGTNTFKLSSNSVYTVSIKDHVKSIQGAAQRNVLAEVAAKLSSLRWVSYLGVALFLFGLGTLFYPPLRMIIASVTTSVAITLGGLFLTILPVLVVGHEILILSAVFGIIGVYWWAHRHGTLKGALDTLKEQIK